MIKWTQDTRPEYDTVVLVMWENETTHERHTGLGKLCNRTKYGDY